jgi:hypothetical protein
MPVVRYFFFVGGVLLALLFAFDAALPKLPVVARSETSETGIELPVVRIHSDRKWPDAIVFDTRVAAMVPAQVAEAEVAIPAPTNVADLSATARVRDAFAQLEPAYPKRQELKLQPKHKAAKNRVAALLVVVAQQPRSGFSAGNTW